MDEIDVSEITAKEVATAINIINSLGKARFLKTIANTGTMTNPPPIPNNPANTPDTIPNTILIQKISNIPSPIKTYPLNYKALTQHSFNITYRVFT